MSPPTPAYLPAKNTNPAPRLHPKKVARTQQQDMIKLAYTGTARLKNILTPYQPYGDPDMGKAIPQIRDNPPHLLIIHAPEPVYPIYGTPIEQIITELADSGTTIIIIQPDDASNIAHGLPHTIYLTPQDDLTPYLIVAGLAPQPGTALTIEEPETEYEVEPESETVTDNEPGVETTTNIDSEPGVETVTEFVLETVRAGEPGPEPGAEAEIVAETEAGNEYGAGIETVSASEPEPEPATDAGPQNGAEPGTEAEPEPGAETETVAGNEYGSGIETVWAGEFEPEPEPATDADPQNGAEPGTEADPEEVQFEAGMPSGLEATRADEPEAEPEIVAETETVAGDEYEPEPGVEAEMVAETETVAGDEPEVEIETVAGDEYGAEPGVEAEMVAETETAAGKEYEPGIEAVWVDEPETEIEGGAGFSLETVDGSGIVPANQLEWVSVPNPDFETVPEPESEPKSGSGFEGVESVFEGEILWAGEFKTESATESKVVEEAGSGEISAVSGQVMDKKLETAAKLNTAFLNVEDGIQRDVDVKDSLSMPEPEAGAPVWLSEPDPEPVSEPVFESAPMVEPASENSAPDWLTPEPAPAVEAAANDNTPDWLAPEPTVEPVSDFVSTVEPETMPVAENNTPDWLAPESAPAPVVEPMVEAAADNTPDWLTQPASESTPVVEPASENSAPGWLAPESAPAVGAVDNDNAPDWLAPEPTVEPVSDFVSTVEPETMPVAENNTPDWLAPESAPAPVVEPMVEAAADNTPDWLTQPASESTPVVEPASENSAPDWLTPESESAPVVEVAANDSTPGWLTSESASDVVSTVESETTPDWLTSEPASDVESTVEPETTPAPASNPTLIDTPQNWTTTTTTAQNTPDWVKQKTQTATTPTPTTTTVTTLTTPTRPTIPTITSTRHTLATLISAKGGVGKTLLTITLADTAVRYGPGGYRVSIIDANRGQADIGPYLNLPETTPSIYQTTQNHNPLLQHLTPNRINQYRQGLGDVGYAVTLAPPTDLSDPHLIDTSLYTETINTITENSNLTLIDTATTENYDTTSLIEDVVIPATLNHAGWIIAVTDTSRTGATNLAKRLNQYFMKGVSPAKTIIVINQATNPNDPAYQQAAKTLQPLGTPIITIPHSSLVYQLSAQARMATSAPNMAPPLQQVLATVTGQPGFVNNTNPTPTTVTAISSPKAGNKSGFFNKLFK